VRHLLAVKKIFHEGGAAFSSPQLILVVGNFETLIGRQGLAGRRGAERLERCNLERRLGTSVRLR